MDVGSLIVIFVGSGVLAAIGTAGFVAWARHSAQSTSNEEIMKVMRERDHAIVLHKNARNKLASIRREYQIDLDDDEEGIDPDADEDVKLSELASLLGHKIPAPYDKFIDSPAIKGLLMKQLEKNPEKIMGIVEQFMKPKTAAPATPQTTMQGYV